MIRSSMSMTASFTGNSRPSSAASRYSSDPIDIAPPMEPSMTCMSVVLDGSTLAFACYDEERNEILLETCRASGNETEEIVSRFLQFSRPNLVLVGSKIINNPTLLQLVTRVPENTLIIDDDDDDDGDGGQDEQNRDIAAANTAATGPPTSTTGPPTNTITQQDASRVNGAGPEQQQPRPTNRHIPYRIMKSGSFDMQKCKVLILQKLRVLTLLQPNQKHENHPGIHDPLRQHRRFPQPHGEQDRYFTPSPYHSLAAIIDFDSKVQVQALGSLISFLQTTVFRMDNYQMVTVNQILFANLPLFMHIDSDTLAALHIFATEHHPLIAKGRGHAKEGWSLFSLMDRTRSKGGRQLLREWMLKPLVDPQAITARQDAIETFTQINMETGVGILLDLLGKVGPIDKILARMQKCNTQPADFSVLARSISAAVAISNAMQKEILPVLDDVGDDTQSHRFLADISARCNAPILVGLMERILGTVDEEATYESQTSVVIRRGLNEELDRWKDQYDALEDMLQQFGTSLSNRHPELGTLAVVFIPQVGFLVSLEKQLVLRNELRIPPDFTHIFNQDEESFFKNNDMRDLDANVGDLDGMIKDTEGMIVTELEECILDMENELRQCSTALSELDCILSFADCAVDLDFSRPLVMPQDSNIIYIKDGRHPLQEIISEKEFVRNDTQLDENNRVAVITGPNYSGKSCYLRQVGILVYMTHIGSFIPCSEARISITDKLFARICTVETCAVPQSSFQLDLTQMASIMLKCTSRSLVLVDEFGKGTSPSSGIALLGAALKKFSQIRCKGICTTHFLELFSAAVIQDGVDGIKTQRMTIHLPENEDDTASPLFKLEDGVASNSAGLVCAKRAGVNRKVISRAKEIMKNISEGRDIAPLLELNPPAEELSTAQREMLQYFYSVENWDTASDDQIRTLIQMVARI